MTGGRQPSGFDTGFYYEPTILACPDGSVPSVMEELFGPVLSVLTFDTEDEAVALANGTPFGLASGVFTKDLSRARRMIRRLRAGVVWVNTYRAVSPIVPFGGYGLVASGERVGSDQSWTTRAPNRSGSGRPMPRSPTRS